MGRPKGGKNKKYSYEFKLQAVKDFYDNHLSNLEVMDKYSITQGTLDVWKKNYLDGCLNTGRKRPGNPFLALYTSKSLTNEQRLELENLKLRIENERLKKGYQVKGGGANKEYITLNNVNIKSLKH